MANVILGIIALPAAGNCIAQPPALAHPSIARLVVDTGAEAALESRLSRLENRVDALQQQVFNLQAAMRARATEPPAPPAPILPAAPLPQAGAPAAPDLTPPVLSSHDAVLIQRGYDAGEGRATVLRVPQGWRADVRTQKSTTRVRSVTVERNTALVVAQQDDRVTVTDPSTGQRHLVESVRAWQDEWRRTAQGWAFGRHVLDAGGPDLVDGRVVAEHD